MLTRFRRALPFVPVWLSLAGCEEAQRLMKKLDAFNNPDQAYVPVPGQPAQGFLEPVSGSVTSDVDSTLEAMTVVQSEKAAASLRAAGLTDTSEGKPATVSEGGAAVLQGSQKAKEGFASTGFKQDEESFFQRKAPSLALRPERAFSLADETVTWSSAADKFTISTLKQMPVRDQANRGTCASHAGIGQVEALILKKFPNISSIDLSEQRFYFMSKPDHWADGGDPASEGSEAGSGFATSTDYDWKGMYPTADYPADWPSGLNIPLESDCPYGPNPGANDVQIPHPAGCNKGVVKITDYVAWIHDADKDLTTPQQIYDFLLEKDYPVITGTKLSDNWLDNDGIITLADAGSPGDSPHAAGHAYLIVGARKLSEAEFPGEGGMCFIIKNSWGTGWGVNGLSCMTLAWYNAWKFSDSTFGVALDLEMDADAVAKAKEDQGKVPEGAAEPDPGTKASDDLDPFGGLNKKRGEAHIDNFMAGGGAHLSASDFTVGELWASDSQTYKLLYKTDGTTFTVRGMLKGQAKMTNDLAFGVRDGKYLAYPPGEEGAKTFGEFDEANKRITLCSQKYASVCELNYQSDWNELLVGLTEGEARSEAPAEPFSWKGVDLAGYGIELSIPEDRLGRVDLRFKLDGNYTNPQRFAVDPVGGAIQWHGKDIGNYLQTSLCSGDFTNVCRVVVAGSNFNVFMKAQKK